MNGIRYLITAAAGTAAIMAGIACAASAPAAHPSAVAASGSPSASATPFTCDKACEREASQVAKNQARQARRQEKRKLARDKRKLIRALRIQKEADQIEFIVTGSPSDVTYGPSGTDLSGGVPMDVTQKLRNPEYYAISAQLNGDGSVSCEIKVGGKVVSRGQASGSYNIASCEISQNPLTGNWEDDN